MQENFISRKFEASILKYPKSPTFILGGCWRADGAEALEALAALLQHLPLLLIVIRGVVTRAALFGDRRRQLARRMTHARWRRGRRGYKI